jgi:hypothetical protein
MSDTFNLVLPDAMFDIRYWLRNDPILNSLHNGRVFFRLSRTTIAPMLRISRLGGGLQPNTEAPVQDIQVVVEVWGMKNSDYESVRKLTIAIEHVCNQYPARTPLNPTGNTAMQNVLFQTAYDKPDDETGWPRMICHITCTVTATSPTVVG